MIFALSADVVIGRNDLDVIEKKLKKLEKHSFSILDEIRFRISLSTIAWYHGIVNGLPEETMKKLPEELAEVLRAYYLLVVQVNLFYREIRDRDANAIRLYLGIRKKMLAVIRDIQKGLLGNAIKEMNEVVSVLNSHLSGQRESKPSEHFKVFWEKYTQASEYFSTLFLLSYPESYDPRIEAEYSSALGSSLDQEESLLNLALEGKLELAISQVEEWSAFMEKFVGRNNYRMIPTRTIL